MTGFVSDEDLIDYLIKEAGFITRFLYWLQNLFASIVGMRAYNWFGITLAKILNNPGKAYLLDVVHDEVRKAYEDYFDGVIFGHSHISEFDISGEEYNCFYFLNTGDWVGSDTYIEYEDGKFSLNQYVKVEDTIFHSTRETLDITYETE